MRSGRQAQYWIQLLRIINNVPGDVHAVLADYGLRGILEVRCGQKEEGTMPRKRRSVRACIYDWDSWVELCGEYGVDPWDTWDIAEDRGLGDSIDYEYMGDMPEGEE